MMIFLHSHNPWRRMRRFWPAALTGATGVLLGLLATAGMRGLETWCGPTLFTHAAVWLVATVAFAVGLAVAGRRLRPQGGPGGAARRAAAAAAWALLAAGVWGLLCLPCTGWLARAWMRFLITPGRSCAIFLATLVLAALLVLAVPMGGIGVAFAAGPWSDSGNRPWPALRRLSRWALLAAGVLLGAWIARQYALPVLGMEPVLRLAAIWAGLLTGAQLWRLAGGTAGRWVAGLVATCVPVLAVLIATTREPVTALGFFGRWASRDEGFVAGRLLRYTDGRSQSVAVYEHPDFGRVLLLDGAPVAYSDRYRSGRILAAHIPLLLRPAARRVALVGAAAGIELPSVQTHPVTAITSFAPDPETARWAADFMAAGGLDATATNRSPSQRAPAPPVTFCRSSLPSWWSPHAYDVVLVSGGPAWDTAAAGVLQAPVLRRCRRAATEDGLVALALDTRGFTTADFQRTLRSFHAVFPFVQVWCVGAEQWLLVGCNTAIKAPVDRMLTELDNEAVFRDLVRAGVRSLPEALACYVCDTAGVEALAGKTGGGVSAPRLAWHVLQSQFDPVERPAALAAAETRRSWRVEWLLPGQLDPDLFVALLDRTGRCIATRVAAVAIRLGLAKPGGSANAGVATDLRGDVLIREALDHLDIKGRRALARGVAIDALHCYQAMLQLSPGSAPAHYGLGLAARDAGQMQMAFQHLMQAVQVAPDVTDYRLDLGRLALQLDQADEADRQFRAVLAREPKNIEATYRLSCALAAKGPGRDVQQAMRLAEQACLASQWSNAEYVWGLADRYLDAGMIKEGMALKRKLKQLGYGR